MMNKDIGPGQANREKLRKILEKRNNPKMQKQFEKTEEKKKKRKKEKWMI